MDEIRIDVSVHTVIEVDLREFDFTGISKLIMTFKNILSKEEICVREFTSAGLHSITITPAESEAMRDDAEYDFMIVTSDGKCYKNGDNGKISLRKGCGQCRESQ